MPAMPVSDLVGERKISDNSREQGLMGTEALRTP